MNAQEMEFLQTAFQQKTVLCNRSFLSCSLLVKVALAFHDMYVTYGSKVLFVIHMSFAKSREFAYVRPYSKYPKEEEVVVRPYRRFTIDSIAFNNTYKATMVVLRPNYS